MITADGKLRRMRGGEEGRRGQQRRRGQHRGGKEGAKRGSGEERREVKEG